MFEAWRSADVASQYLSRILSLSLSLSLFVCVCEMGMGIYTDKWHKPYLYKNMRSLFSLS